MYPLRHVFLIYKCHMGENLGVSETHFEHILLCWHYISSPPSVPTVTFTTWETYFSTELSRALKMYTNALIGQIRDHFQPTQTHRTTESQSTFGSLYSLVDNVNCKTLYEIKCSGMVCIPYVRWGFELQDCNMLRMCISRTGFIYGDVI